MNSLYDPCPCASGSKFKFCCLDAIKTGNYAKANIEKYPVQCFGSANHEGNGLNMMIVVRKMGDNNYVVGSYLVDVWCMGVKDAFVRVSRGLQELSDFIEEYSKQQDMAVYPYELARSLIFASVAYADRIGIAPHPDWEKAKFLIEPHRPWEHKFTFGRDGKPFYVPGPYDKHIQDRIIKKVINAGGDYGFEE